MFHKLKLMYDRKKHLAKIVKKYNTKVAIWWCICDYICRKDESLYIREYEILLDKAKNNLYVYMKAIASEWFSGLNSYKVKKNFLEDEWKDGYLFSLNICEAVSEVIRIFLEHIPKKDEDYYDYDRYKSIAQRFYAEKESIIELLSSHYVEDNGSIINLTTLGFEPDTIKEYIEKRFTID